MITLKHLQQDLAGIAARLKTRNFTLNVAWLEQALAERKAALVEAEVLRMRRNALARDIGKKKAKGEDASALMQEAETVNARLSAVEASLNQIQAAVDAYLLTIPNLPHDSVPVGGSSDDNVEVRRWIPGPVGPDGNPAPLPFAPKDHVELGNRMGLKLDTAAALSGSRFAYMAGAQATLHRALAQFMLSLHVGRHGYTECYVPYIVNASALRGTGQLPKFKDDMFQVVRGGDEQGEPQYLISTGEIPLTNSVANQHLNGDELPLKLVTHTPCFRSEAGSAGRDTRGLIRQHQFDKVEMVQITRPDQSYAALEEMVQQAEAVLQALGLPYRVVQLCTGDMGFSAAKTYDLEVWVPSQNTWREISSVSNCEAFQAHRMNARMRDERGNQHVHTLNGSGVAVGRAMVAVMENYQQADGTVAIPEVLKKYMRA